MKTREGSNRIIGWRLIPANGGNFVFLPRADGYVERDGRLCQLRDGGSVRRVRIGRSRVERVYA